MTKQGEWDVFHKAIQGGVTRVLLIGPPGVGKSFSAHCELVSMGFESYQWTCCEDQLMQEAMGHWIVRGQSFIWNDGPWTRAMRNGALIINEIARASVSMRDAALAILDNSDTCSIALPTGEMVRPHARFVCVCTSNDTPEDAGMSDALVDRFELILTVASPHPSLVERLNKGENGLGTLIEKSYTDAARAISPRKALTYLKLKTIFPQEQAFNLAFGDRAADISAAWKLAQGGSK